jgi:hypothetical protein
MSLIGEEYATIEDAFSGNSLYEQFLAFKDKENGEEIAKLQQEKESSFQKQFGRTMEEAKLVIMTNVPVRNLFYYVSSNGYHFIYDKTTGKWEVKTHDTLQPVENPFSNETPVETPKETSKETSLENSIPEETSLNSK